MSSVARKHQVFTYVSWVILFFLCKGSLCFQNGAMLVWHPAASAVQSKHCHLCHFVLLFCEDQYVL